MAFLNIVIFVLLFRQTICAPATSSTAATDSDESDVEGVMDFRDQEQDCIELIFSKRLTGDEAVQVLRSAIEFITEDSSIGRRATE